MRSGLFVHDQILRVYEHNTLIRPLEFTSISALSPGNPLMWLSQITIQGKGIERLEILGENTKPVQPGPLSIARVPGAGMRLLYPTAPIGWSTRIRSTRARLGAARQLPRRWLRAAGH
jgi:hypothetical protein